MDVRSWTLGDDLRPEDNLLDGITIVVLSVIIPPEIFRRSKICMPA